MSEDIDISDIFAPPENLPKLQEERKIEAETVENFVHYYPHPKPLIENQPEYFSSEEERMTIAAPRLPQLAQKKAAQKRMRLIILVDIVLFLVILGVIYPSLHKLQTHGKLAGYRFSIEQSSDAQLLNILIKTERLSSTKSQAKEYQVRILQNQEQIYQGQSVLPQFDSPVKYALFPLTEPSTETQNFDIIIQIGQEEKKFFLSIKPK